MSKGQTPKIHGSIVNAHVNVSETCNHLPREGNCEEVILVKLKRKLSVKGIFILSRYAHRQSYVRVSAKS